MSARRSRSGGIVSPTTLRRYQRSWRKRPAETAACRSWLVAAISRTFILIVRVPPTRSTSWCCRARKSFACSAGASSPISSRKIVPPSATSNLPFFSANAPVNAPFSWPNSSLSSSDSVSAAQLTATNGREARGLFWCTARAASSLPVPVSPVMSTVESRGATLRMHS